MRQVPFVARRNGLQGALKLQIFSNSSSSASQKLLRPQDAVRVSAQFILACTSLHRHINAILAPKWLAGTWCAWPAPRHVPDAPRLTVRPIFAGFLAAWLGRACRPVIVQRNTSRTVDTVGWGCMEGQLSNMVHTYKRPIFLLG